MVVLEAANKVYEVLLKNDSFNMKENFKDIILITENRERDEAAILCALKGYVDSGILQHARIKDEDYWTLTKNLLLYDLTVTISPETAALISAVLNKLSTHGEAFEHSKITHQQLRAFVLLAADAILAKHTVPA